MPSDLTDKGTKAYNIIMQVLIQYSRNFTDCRAFYSPIEWSKNIYLGPNCHLVISYNYGDLKDIFHMDSVLNGAGALRQHMMQQLAANNFYTVELSDTCTAIFSLHTFSNDNQLS